ncbi:MAG: Trp family transcriptional regulator [Candidatus Woesebacteria bacterium]|jgi:uncharacterized protein YerC
MRKSKKKLNPSLKKEIKKTLAQVIVDIKSVDEGKVFLEDFLSETEYEILAKRLAISYWLKKERSYKNIKNNLKVSSATISSVQSQMDQKGFKTALKKIEAEEWANQWAEKIKKFIK